MQPRSVWEAGMAEADAMACSQTLQEHDPMHARLLSNYGTVCPDTPFKAVI